MLSRGPALLLPLLAILCMSDFVLEAEGDPNNQALRADIRAFLARLVLMIATTVLGSYLSLHQLAKSHSMYQARKSAGSQSAYTSTMLDFLLSSPVAIAVVGAIVAVGLFIFKGDDRVFIAYVLPFVLPFLGMIPISSIILFSMPVAKKLKAIRVGSFAWFMHDREITALDVLSYGLAVAIHTN